MQRSRERPRSTTQRRTWRASTLLCAFFVSTTHTTPASAAEPAPPSPFCSDWLARDVPRCLRGYVQASPVGLKVLLPSLPGYGANIGAGMFFAGRKFALAFGPRLDYGYVPASGSRFHIIEVGPELRLGGTTRRIFGYALLRGGFTHLREEQRFRGAEPAPPINNVWHIAYGGGLWWRGPRNLLLGGELQVEYPALPTLSVSLALGWWL